MSRNRMKTTRTCCSKSFQRLSARGWRRTESEASRVLCNLWASLDYGSVRWNKGNENNIDYYRLMCDVERILALLVPSKIAEGNRNSGSEISPRGLIIQEDQHP